MNYLKLFESFDNDFDVISMNNILNIARDEGLNIDTVLLDENYPMKGFNEWYGTHTYMVCISNHNSSPEEILDFDEYINIVQNLFDRCQGVYDNAILSLSLFPGTMEDGHFKMAHLLPLFASSNEIPGILNISKFFKDNPTYHFKDYSIQGGSGTNMVESPYQLNGINIAL